MVAIVALSLVAGLTTYVVRLRMLDGGPTPAAATTTTSAGAPRGAR